MEREKTIKNIFIISLVIHVIYIIAYTIIIVMQKGIAQDFPLDKEIGFVIPFEYYISLFKFIMHITFTLVVLSKIKDVYSSRLPEVLGICLFSGVFTFAYDFIFRLQVVLARVSVDILYALNNVSLYHGYIVFLRKISITLFIVACSMSWYGKTTSRN